MFVCFQTCVSSSQTNCFMFAIIIIFTAQCKFMADAKKSSRKFLFSNRYILFGNKHSYAYLPIYAIGQLSRQMAAIGNIKCQMTPPSAVLPTINYICDFKNQKSFCAANVSINSPAPAVVYNIISYTADTIWCHFRGIRGLGLCDI